MKNKEMYELNFKLEELPSAAKKFIELIGDDKIFLFEGEMGSGKTTFIAEVCRQLGADDDFGSPTFSLVNEYVSAAGESIYHFDLYRIESLQEIIDMGADEYFESGNLCLVEWPERLGALQPMEARRVVITVNPDRSRTLCF